MTYVGRPGPVFTFEVDWKPENLARVDDANEFEDGDGDGGGDEEHASTSGTITVAAQWPHRGCW